MNPLVCLRKVAGKPPPVPSKHGACSLCSASVWVALSSPPITDDIWCLECTAVQIALSDKASKPVAVVARPTELQLADLAAHWNKR